MTAMLDIMFEERGQTPLKEFEGDASAIESAWFEHLMPVTTRDDVAGLLKTRRYVIIQGPPGTGKTRMAREMLDKDYAGIGQTIQFHPIRPMRTSSAVWRQFRRAPAIMARLGFASLQNPDFSWKLRPEPRKTPRGITCFTSTKLIEQI